jgi:hypothetical protein
MLCALVVRRFNPDLAAVLIARLGRTWGGVKRTREGWGVGFEERRADSRWFGTKRRRADRPSPSTGSQASAETGFLTPFSFTPLFLAGTTQMVC